MNSTYLQFREYSVSGNSSFAGANTSSGFVSEYESICRGAQHIYIIKGSSGCGKSSKLREIAELADKHGIGVRRYYCGSDPLSLDAVELTNGEKKVVLLDGTAPHAVEARYPKLISEIVDFGVYLSEAKLKPFEKELVSCSEGKARAYSQAYKCLKWADAASKEIAKLSSDSFDRDKARAAVGRLLGRCELGSGAVRECYMHAVTMRGCAHLAESDENDARVIELSGDIDECVLLMATVGEMCLSRGAEHTVCRSPIDPSEALEIRLPAGGMIFRASVTASGSCERMNTSRFFGGSEKAATRGARRFYAKLRESVFSSALESLELAARYHFRLEEIYGSAMDFDLLNEHMCGFYSEVLSRLL